MKYSEYFDLQELVPPEIFNQFGAKSRWFLDPRSGPLLDAIRELVDRPITINDWKEGGPFDERGYRLPWATTGGKLSQHKLGKAFDLEIQLDAKIPTYEKFRDLIRYNFEHLSKLGLSTIEEDTPTWLHIDMRDTGLDHLYEVPFK